MYAVIIICAVLLLAAIVWILAIMPRVRNRPDLSEFRKYDYAHRGLHRKDQTVPENSLAAFRLAAEQGFGIELDVQLTLDGKAVVFHDGNLKRMCGVEKQVCALSYEELRQVPLAGTAERIPLFTDVLAAVAGRVPLIVEVKGYDRREELCRKTAEFLKNYRGLWCMESFYPDIVMWFRKNMPEAVRGFLSMRYEKDTGPVSGFLAENLFPNFLTRPDFIAYRYSDRKNVSLRACRKLYGVQEVSWTLTEPDQLKEVKREGGLGIFQYFDPRESQSKLS